MDNDTRGWIMCVTSGVACILGASIICVDVLVRRIPGKENFKIQDSSAFLASSLSLSFGVMIFSSLNNMLPSSKTYLVKGGLSDAAASWILLACFIGGMIGIQITSSLLHDHIPSHAVNCDHSHEDTTHGHSRRHSKSHTDHHAHTHPTDTQEVRHGKDSESTPLLHSQNGGASRPISSGRTSHAGSKPPSLLPRPRGDSDPPARRLSIIEVPQRIVSIVTGTKANCHEGGPCYGYSGTCNQDCFKHLGAKLPTTKAATDIQHPTVFRATTDAFPSGFLMPATTTLDEQHPSDRVDISPGNTTAHSYTSADEAAEPDEDLEAQHHHHVPENAFMSLGLQTSIAIALHKLPEGFITFATNHANPSLGFSVFTALFIHNISEGFALALPLFLALHSRVRAMLWAFLLGSVSQPLGAGIAAAWFKIVGRDGHMPGSVLYGCMFAITAGIMTSVALTLFLEALSLRHNRNLCIAFGFAGMGMMGVSNALTAG